MKLGIMQPYFVPYIGYWQLMNAVDQYVVYDDVNFIKGGWINRNQILINGEPSFFNIPMKGASSYKKINEIKVDFNKREQKKSIIKIENAYRKAPYFENIQPLVKEIISCESNILSEFIYNSFLL